MSRFLLAATLLCAAFSPVVSPALGADLTALETRWLGAAFPVLQYARGQVLPLDIIVQQRARLVEVGMERALDPAMLAASKALRQTRREEGYGDLVALAWTRRRHPDDYVRVHAWLACLRQRDDMAPARDGHDTRAWVALAQDGKRFGAAARPFEDALPLWREGLMQAE